MVEQQTSIFRKQSIESVSSPEQLNDYIKSATPSVWFIMTAVIVLLIGVCVWGIFGHLDTTVMSGAVCENGTLTMYFPEQYAATLTAGMTVTVNDCKYTLTEVSSMPVQITDSTDPYVLHVSGLSEGDFGITAAAQTDLPDGIYNAAVTVESIKPMSLVIN